MTEREKILQQQAQQMRRNGASFAEVIAYVNLHRAIWAAAPKPTQAMLAAVRAVCPQSRRAAAACAERAFVGALAKLEAFGDFTSAEHVRLAGDAAAAEVAYQFPKARAHG